MKLYDNAFSPFARKVRTVLLEHAAHDLEEIYRSLDTQLAGKAFVCGNLSIADFALFPHLAAVKFLDVPFSPERHPSLFAMSMNQSRRARLLRTAFLAGTVTDALALIPLLFPPAARLMWGFEDFGGPYQSATGYAASLMLGWTALLVWAYQHPLERAFVAALTVIVIYGLIVKEAVAVVSGHLALSQMIPTWCLQAVLLGLFAGAYHYPLVESWFAADAGASTSGPPGRQRALEPPGA